MKLSLFAVFAVIATSVAQDELCKAADGSVCVVDGVSSTRAPNHYEEKQVVTR